MKKIHLFSAKAMKSIEGEEAELYVNFYLVFNRNYIFTFAIEAPNLMCSDRHPIRLWKHFLMMLEEENVKYLRRYENTISKRVQGITREAEETGALETQRRVMNLPPVQPKIKTGLCKDCKWWKDSDGAYRRGIGAESQCPMNRKEVYEGNGYCFLFEPQESEGV